MKYKLGDKVRITTDKSKSTEWNYEGMMDKWLGKVMTIRECHVFEDCTTYRMKEDIAERCGGWNWHEEMIDGLAEESTKPKHSITITSDGKTTTAVFTVDGREVKKGIAKCSPEDKFNFKTGAELALERMWGKKEQKEKHWYFSKEKMLARGFRSEYERDKKRMGFHWVDQCDGKQVENDDFGKYDGGKIGRFLISKKWCEYR